MLKLLAVLLVTVSLSAPADAQYVRLDPSGGEAPDDFAADANPDLIGGAQRAYVAYVVLDQIPFVREGGTKKWDAMSGPDLIVRVVDTQGNAIATTTAPVVEDVRTDALPLSFELNAQVSDLERVYAVEVLDHDEWSANELMFRTQSVAAADAQRDGRPSLPLLSRSGHRIGTIYFRFE